MQSAEGSIFDQGGTILGKDDERVGAGGAPNFIASSHVAERFEAFKVSEGRLPRAANEVVLDKATARKEKYDVGDTVPIQGELPKRDYTLVGLAQIAGVDSFGGAAVALMTLPEAQRVTGKTGEFDEILIAGPIDQVATRIVEARQRARDSKGWIMDTYLLRRR